MKNRKAKAEKRPPVSLEPPRRSDLPTRLRVREERLRFAMKHLVGLFPGVGIALLVFDVGTDPGPENHMSYISNATRGDMIRALRDQAERLEMGTEDTAGRGEV